MSSIVPRATSPAMYGRVGGPIRGLCEVLAYRKIGAYHSLTFVAPEMAEQAQPGQFVSIAVEGAGTLLRRPFSIYAVSRHGPWAGTIEIVFDVVGPGTRWLAERAKHDVVDLVAPLGKPFPLPAQPVPCLLVGGGYGAAPLLYLAQLLQQQGLRVDMVMGAATHERIFNAIEAKRLSAGATFTTDDGSFGEQGVVTDVMDRVIEQAGTKVIYACGPMGMLAGVAAIAQRRGISCQVAVEEEMACGVGVCMTCVVPYRRKEQTQHLRACVDGPVFNAARIDWAALGYGAPASAAEPGPEGPA